MNIKAYQSGLKFMLINAVNELYGGEVIIHHSLDHGMHASIISETVINKKEVKRIKEKMIELTKKSIPFNRKNISSEDAYNFFLKKKEYEKALNISTIGSNTITMFEFAGKYNYFYSVEMPDSSSDCSLFDIYYVEPNEIVLTYPVDGKMDFVFRQKVYDSFFAYDLWLNRININNVSDVNKIVADGKILDLIKKNDIMVDNSLYEIAREIIEKGKKVILLSGPSSSGKTTTSRKLSLYLSSFGVNAFPLSLDDFFLNRVDTPLDKDGVKDYECLEALDLHLFNGVLDKLLNGEDVRIPKYNFILGEKEFSDEYVSLGENDVLVIEGLHALNPRLINRIDDNLLYKIYVSPLTPLNVDRHNYVSTADNRLIRRIVRDFKTRGRSAEESLKTWSSVRRGEEMYIFPFTDEADAIVNTAYVYEMGVLKVYIEPLLASIKMDSPCYGEARRLLDNLKSFYSIPSEYVSDDNLLREFIGGSSFEE